MKSSKLQNPKPNKPSTFNPEPSSLNEGWHDNSDPQQTGPLVLKDEPIKPTGLHPFDLEERTAKFGEEVVRFTKKIPHGPTNNRLIDQLVGAGTSVGANFCEASDSVSKKDFRYTVKRCIKEAKEARFFLRMVVAAEPSLSDEARHLYREATQLVRILATMHGK